MEQHEQIVKVATNGGFSTYKEAEDMVLTMYVPDMSYERSEITLALTKLREHFDGV